MKQPSWTLAWVLAACAVAGCPGPQPPGDAADAANEAAPPDGSDAAADVELARGCPVLREPVARPGDPPMGDTYAELAAPLFAAFCNRCHSTRLTTGAERSGAPTGMDWDDEASVRMNLARIRNAVGVLNYMPLTPPDVTCEQRRRMARWVDLGAP